MEINLSFLRDQGNKNDFIGTAYLHLSAISGQGGLGEGKQRSWSPVSCPFKKVRVPYIPVAEFSQTDLFLV